MDSSSSLVCTLAVQATLGELSLGLSHWKRFGHFIACFMFLPHSLGQRKLSNRFDQMFRG